MGDSETGTYVEQGSFDRDMNYIPDRIVRDPEAGVEPRQWPVEPGRYRLVAAKACPWANRAIIVRRLLGLEDVISLGLCGPTHDARSWTFDLDEGGVDPVLGIERIQQAYLARYPDYPRGITVPAVVDVPSGQVVTNDFPAITHDFFFEWREHHRDGAPDLWPAEVREEMEAVMKRVFTEVNNGVYRCGFAGSQEAYEDAYDRLWTAMDWLEERLADRRYLMGDTITEADVRLFTTLARFDAVYHGHFKCNRNKLTEMPHLWAYARDLFQTPRLRGDHRLRPDQGSLLQGPHRREPDRDRAEGPRAGLLAHPPRPGVARLTRLARPTRPAADPRPAPRSPSGGSAPG